MAEPRTVRENANSLTSEEIGAILPHRYPFALVDRILDYEPGQWAIGRKCVTRNEEFFCGHFPGQPVMLLVLTTVMSLAWSPKTARMAAVSQLSFMWVPVPWALMWSICSGAMPPSLRVSFMQPMAPAPPGAGAVKW